MKLQIYLYQSVCNEFLKDISIVISSMNEYGYYKEGSFILHDNVTEREKETLKKYQILEDNCLFDTDNYSEVFFPVAVIIELLYQR